MLLRLMVAVVFLVSALPARAQVGNPNENVEATLGVSEFPPGTQVPPPNAEGNIESLCWPRAEVVEQGEIHVHIR